MINITLTHAGPALADSAAAATSIELRTNALCRVVDCVLGRLTIIGLVTSFKSTAVLSTGHGVSTPHRYQRALSPGTGRS